MAAITGWLYSTISHFSFQPDDALASLRYGAERYKPSVQDVLIIKKALNLRSKLPFELIDLIVDMANYWPHTTTSLLEPVTIRGGRHEDENQFLFRSLPLGYLPTRNNKLAQLLAETNQPYIVATPLPWPESQPVPKEATQDLLSRWTLKSLPKGEHPCRKIVFTIESHDQGFGGSWGHKGTYEGSYTWFDVGLERTSATHEMAVTTDTDLAPKPQFNLNQGLQVPVTDKESSVLICSLQTIIPTTPQEPGQEPGNDFHHPLLPSSMALQRNATATRYTKKYEITWSYDDKVFPDSLEAAELDKQGRGSDTANGEFVRNLNIGDVVTIWAKARFPLWQNEVKKVTMDIYWAV